MHTTAGMCSTNGVGYGDNSDRMICGIKSANDRHGDARATDGRGIADRTWLVTNGATVSARIVFWLSQPLSRLGIDGASTAISFISLCFQLFVQTTQKSTGT